MANSNFDDVAVRRPLKAAEGMEFRSLESEEYRTYVFAKDGHTHFITIINPVGLHVRDSGAHCILDGIGMSHYIPTGWIHLQWKSREGSNHFDF